MNGRKAGSIILLVVMVVVAVSVLFTNHLVGQLAEEEKKNMAIWAEATRQLILADEETDIDFVSTIIENNTHIPVYMTDSVGHILSSRNVEKPVEDPRLLNGPIVLQITPDNRQYIYYDESNLLRQLRYVPYLQFVIVLIFITIAVVVLMIVHRSEQNRLWVGLSKETAHQLGTPISSLNAWQELLAERYKDDELIPQMRRDIERLTTIADRFSKIGSEPETGPAEINEVLQEAVRYMQVRISGKVSIDFTPLGREKWVSINVPLFEWVVENMLKNAVDAMEGKGKITIALREKEHEVVIDISDTGKGMDKATQRRIFRAGFTTKSRGWGLGLPLAKRIIEEYHEGRLFVKHSKVGVGTTFCIILKGE